jgi:hypothetical protein
MDKPNKKLQLVLLALSIVASTLVLIIFIITIIRPIVILGQAKQWEEYIIVSDTIKEKSTIIPSRRNVFKEIKTYEHQILYIDNRQEKIVNVNTNEESIKNLTLRKNPKTNELYVRVEFNIEEYSIVLFLIAFCLIMIVLLVNRYCIVKKMKE